MSGLPPAGGISKARKSRAPQIYSKLYNAVLKAFPHLKPQAAQKKANGFWHDLKKNERAVEKKIEELEENSNAKKRGLFAFWGEANKNNKKRKAIPQSSSSSSSSNDRKESPE